LEKKEKDRDTRCPQEGIHEVNADDRADVEKGVASYGKTHCHEKKQGISGPDINSKFPRRENFLDMNKQPHTVAMIGPFADKGDKKDEISEEEKEREDPAKSIWRGFHGAVLMMLCR
jgi:hypothetical protein